MHLTWSAGDNFALMDCCGFVSVLIFLTFFLSVQCLFIHVHAYGATDIYSEQSRLFYQALLSVYNARQRSTAVSSWLEKQMKYSIDITNEFTNTSTGGNAGNALRIV